MQPTRAPMFKTLTIFFFAAFLLMSQMVKAEESTEKYISGALVSGVTGVGNLTVIPMGLNLKLVDGWYTYWRMAGDNGLPPKFDWSGSTNVKDVKVHWPAPSRFTLMDMHSFGYMGNVLFPLDITPETPGKDVILSLKMDVVICHDICIPETLNMSYALSEGSAAASKDALQIQAAVKTLPSLENTKSLGLETAVLAKTAIVATAFSEDGFEDGVELIFESNPPLLFAPPEIIADPRDKTRSVLKISAPDGMNLTEILFGQKITLTLIHKGNAVEHEFSF